MVTTKQKPTADIQNMKGKESNHTTMQNHQFIKEDSEKERNMGTTKHPENIHKMVLVSPYLSNITLNVK